MCYLFGPLAFNQDFGISRTSAILLLTLQCAFLSAASIVIFSETAKQGISQFQMVSSSGFRRFGSVGRFGPGLVLSRYNTTLRHANHRISP